MGSWSQGIYDRGIREGKAAGLAEGKAAGLAEGKVEMLKQFMSNNHTFDEFIELFNIKDEDEIKFLKENI